MASLLREGDWVDVVGGALAGLGGVVRSVNPFAGSAVVDLLIVGRSVPAEFQLAFLRRVAKPPEAGPWRA